MNTGCEGEEEEKRMEKGEERGGEEGEERGGEEGRREEGGGRREKRKRRRERKKREKMGEACTQLTGELVISKMTLPRDMSSTS